MNLIHDPWIPVRRQADNRRRLISPVELTDGIQDNPITVLDAPRADFNGALAQFLIGLLQTLMPPKNAIEWRIRLQQPPTREEIEQRFAAVADAFELDGDRSRFMQDYDGQMGGTRADIAALLIEAPGGQTQKDNTDHFIKAGGVTAVCPACAALALLTLQTNAPAGGAGHRTSLRGGGPLTTLVIHDPRTQPGAKPMLWHDLWLNVLDRTDFLGNWRGEDGPEAWFPWLRPTLTSSKGEIVSLAVAHPAVAFWATPRRIRLDFDELHAGCCDLCGTESERLVSAYLTKPHGANYKGWEHPLSPHYRQKPDSLEWLPTHPQPGGFNYRHWPELVLQGETRTPARVVSTFHRRQADLPATQFLLWAFGYDMDNMKARCWYEARMPLIELADPEQRQLLAALADTLVKAAGEAKGFLVSAIKRAWFARIEDAKGDLSFIDLAFWNATEQPFYAQLRGFAAALKAGEDFRRVDHLARQEWHRELLGVAKNLFDLWAASGAVEFERLKRIAEAHNLMVNLLKGKQFKEKTLGLPPARKPDSNPVKKGVKQ